MAYEDAGHRPHARHTGEEPLNEWDRGPYGITVTLDTWGPQDNLFTSMYDALQSNWGESPNRSAEQGCRQSSFHDDSDVLEDLDHRTGWCRLTDGQRDYVESCFAGKTLPQILELLSFEFTINGCSRACTHQLVRTRIGAAFMQHGGRDNDWRHRRWTMPETIYRACDLFDNTEGHSEIAALGLSNCISDPGPIERYVRNTVDDHPNMDGSGLRGVIENYLMEGRMLYAALVDSGIPWQDARRVLWMGTQTYIHNVYNYLALQGVCNKRLEFAMDWEINAVAQLMVREVRMKCHPLIGKYLQSLSDKLGKEAFAGLESWTPSGKYENPYEQCRMCGGSKDAIWHNAASGPGIAHMGQEVHDYVKGDRLARAHRSEQAPFWVLHPDSMAGGPVKWIPTNGTFPKEF